MDIAITGTPGVGKHTISNALAKNLSNFILVDINRVAISNNYIVKFDRENGHEIDISLLSLKIKEILSYNENSIVVGHLVPYVINDIDHVIVLRRSPYDLIEVYKSRKYAQQKIQDNLISEILGTIMYDSLKKFKDKVKEIDVTGKNVSDIINILLHMTEGREIISLASVDWLSLLESKGDLKKFFHY